MELRLVSCFMSVLWLGTATADESQPCPCVSASACPNMQAAGPWAPCEDPDTVRCCHVSPSFAEKHNEEPDLPPEIKDHLEKEHTLKDTIDNVLEEMIKNITNDEPKVKAIREDKSISTGAINNLDCDKKQCADHLKDKQKVKNIQVGALHNEKEHSETDLNSSGGETKKQDKLIIVYGEKMSKDNLLNKDNSKPVIVYATKEPLQETSTDDIGHLEQNNIQSIKSTVSETSSQSRRNPSFGIRKQQTEHLHKLFPRRQALITRKPQQEEDAQKFKGSKASKYQDEIETAGTDIDEQTVISPSTVDPSIPVETPEPIQVQKFKLPPRRLPSQQSDGQIKQIHTNTRGQIRGAQTTSGMPINSEVVNTHQNPVHEIMDEINVKVINNVMNTQFTRKPLPRRRPNPNVAIKPFRYHPTSRDNPQLNMNHQTQGEPQFQTKNPESHSDPKAIPSGDTIQAAGPVTADTSKRTPPRAWQHTRPQNIHQPPQEQEFDTSRNTPRLREYSRRRQQPRPRVRPDVKAAQEIDPNKSPISDINQESISITPATYTGRRLRQKLRGQVESSQKTDQKGNFRPNENIQTETSAVAPQQVVRTKTESPDEVGSGDLEGSGSDNRPQKFVPPKMMQTGFQPMFSEGISITGDIPRGFIDGARGFAASEDIGLELPQFPPQDYTGPQHQNRQNFRQSKTTTEQRFIQPQPNDETQSALLPPVFLAPELAASSQSFDGNRFAPLEPELEIPSVEEMLSQHRDLTNLQQQFSVLKGRYDMLLNRYAEALHQYNSRYNGLLAQKNLNDQNTESNV